VFWPGAFLDEERGIAKDIDRILESNIVLGSVDAIIFLDPTQTPSASMLRMVLIFSSSIKQCCTVLPVI